MILSSDSMPVEGECSNCGHAAAQFDYVGGGQMITLHRWDGYLLKWCKCGCQLPELRIKNSSRAVNAATGKGYDGDMQWGETISQR